MSEFARPRIRWSLVEKIDRLRGRVPRDRYINDALEQHVEQASGSAADSTSPEPDALPAPAGRAGRGAR
jgi:hypothetical protein